MGGAYPIGSQRDGGTLYSDGTVKYPQSGPAESSMPFSDSQKYSTPQNEPSNNDNKSSSNNDNKSSSNNDNKKPDPIKAFGQKFDTKDDYKAYKVGLDRANSAYDYQKSSLLSNRDALVRDRERNMGMLSSSLEGARNSVTGAKQSASDYADIQIGEAGETARGVKRANRNTLRSLGILASSAAGELLSKPLNEFDKQRASIQRELGLRKQQLDDFLVEKTNEHANLVASLEDKYTTLTENINRDLRFNERERINAIEQANASLQARIREIQMAQQDYENRVAAEQSQLAGGLQQINQYQPPSANMQSLEDTRIYNSLDQPVMPSTVGITQDDDKRRKDGDLLSSPFSGYA